MANHMKEVAAILGVELYEEFYLEDDPETKYKLTENGIEALDENEKKWSSDYKILRFLLNGRLTIAKKPWKPEFGERYYVPYVNMGKPDYICCGWGRCVDEDENRYNAGLVCRDKKTAEKIAKIMFDAVKNYEQKNE